MVKLNKDCIEAALKNLVHFDKDDLEQYINDVFDRASQYGDVKNAQAYNRAIKEVNKEYLQSYFEDASVKAQDLIKFNDKKKMIEEKKIDVKNLILYRHEKFMKASENIVAAQKANYQKLFSFVMDDLSPEEQTRFFSGKDKDAIVSAIDGHASDDPFVNKMAKKWHEYRQYSNSRLVISGAMKLQDIRNDRYMRQIHDESRIINAGKSLPKLAADKGKYDMAGSREYWKQKIRERVNLKESFPNMIDEFGNVNEEKFNNVFNKMYDSITTGKSDIFTRSATVNDKQALKNKRRMKLIWKSLSDQIAYNAEFGKGDFTEMWIKDMHASANRIGMAEQFGSNPFSMLLDLKKAQQDINPKSPQYWKEVDTYYNALTKSEIDLNPTLSNIISSLKTVQSMARLGTLGISSFDDMAYTAAFGHRSGLGFYRTLINSMLHAYNLFPTDQRRIVARTMSLNFHSHFGHMGRFIDQNNVPSFLNSISSKFFKVTGMTGWDDGLRTSSMTTLGSRLFDESHKKLSELNPYMRESVQKFLTSDEWDLLRKKNNQKFFSLDNVERLTDDEIKEHHQRIKSDEPLYNIKNDLYRKVHAMFMVNSENAVLTPTLFEKAWLGSTSEMGAPKSILWNLVTQFKSFPLSYVDRVLVGGWKDADSASRKLIWATSLFATTIPLAIGGRLFKDLASGKSLPDTRDMSAAEFERFILESMMPPLGQFFSFIGSRQSPAMTGLNMLGSPSMSMIGAVLATAGDLVAGDLHKAKKDFGRALSYINPIHSVPVIPTIIDNIMGNEAYLEPGQRKVF